MKYFFILQKCAYSICFIAYYFSIKLFDYIKYNSYLCTITIKNNKNMITEYYTEKELVKELNEVSDKFEEMKEGWFGEKLLKLFKKYKKGGRIVQTITHKNQKYDINVIWVDNSHRTQDFGVNISTSYETKNGKVKIDFSQKDKPIIIKTPHFVKRDKERSSTSEILVELMSNVKYIRNGMEYELIEANTNDVIISRRGKEEKRILVFITLLTKDMCTNKNYKELLSRVDNIIDKSDTYQWK